MASNTATCMERSTESDRAPVSVAPTEIGTPPARRPLLSRLLTLRVGTGVWGLADQGIVSIGNFATAILVARALPTEDFGAYGVLFEVFLFLVSLNTSLITYPLSVRGATADTHNLRRLCGASLAMSALMSIPLALVAAGVCLLIHRPGVALWATAAQVLWQLQETLRRGLSAHLRNAAAIPGDAVSYLGQAALIWWLARAHQLTLQNSIAIMALTSLLAAIIQFFQVAPLTVPWEEIRRLARTFWGLGFWALCASITTLFTIPAFPWMLGWSKGLAVVAIYQAFINLLRICHPVMNGVGNLIIPAAARARADLGSYGAYRATMKYAGQGFMLLLPYFALLLLAPQWVIGLAYHGTSGYMGHESILRALVLLYVVLYVAQTLNSLLLALEASRSAFLGQMANSIASVTVGLPMTALAGLAGAVWGNLLCVAIRIGVSVRQLNRFEPLPRSSASEARL